MRRRRQQKDKHAHYAILVNPKAGHYHKRWIEKLTEAIKRKNGYYTVFEPDSAMALLKQAEQATTMMTEPNLPPHIAKRGLVTALVAAGGDGTFNLVARVAMERDLPVGILPTGRLNNIAKSLCGTAADPDEAIAKITQGNYRKIDSGVAADQPFFGSVALGFTVEMAELLKDGKPPRWGFGWSQLGQRAAANVKIEKLIIKIDAFRFEVSPLLLNVNLLSWSAGLPLSTAAVSDDGLAEVIFDMGTKIGDFSALTRAIQKGRYLYGSDVRMYRGKVISVQPTKDRTLYLDGELISLPTASLPIKIGDKQVKVFC